MALREFNATNDIHIGCATPDCWRSVTWWHGAPRPAKGALCPKCDGTEDPAVTAKHQAARDRFKARVRELTEKVRT